MLLSCSQEDAVRVDGRGSFRSDVVFVHDYADLGISTSCDSEVGFEDMLIFMLWKERREYDDWRKVAVRCSKGIRQKTSRRSSAVNVSWLACVKHVLETCPYTSTFMIPPSFEC
jgi:hypothetical protein